MIKVYQRPVGMKKGRRLTDEERAEVREKSEMGISAIKIAKEYGVSAAAIYYSTGRCKRTQYSKEWCNAYNKMNRERIKKAIYDGEL